MSLAEKQAAMRKRHRPFTPRKEFDLVDVQHRLKAFYLWKRGLSIARVAAETGCDPEWLQWWIRFGCPLDS